LRAGFDSFPDRMLWHGRVVSGKLMKLSAIWLTGHWDGKMARGLGESMGLSLIG